MKLAVSLAENFPATLEALAAGEVNSGHARVIDRLAGKPDSKITYLQRNADALVQLITRDGPQRAAAALSPEDRWQPVRIPVAFDRMLPILGT